MPAKPLNNLIRTAITYAAKLLAGDTSKTAVAAVSVAAETKNKKKTKKKKPPPSPDDDATLKNPIGSNLGSSSSDKAKRLLKTFASPAQPPASPNAVSLYSQKALKKAPKSLHGCLSDTFKFGSRTNDEESAKELSREVSHHLYSDMGLDWEDEPKLEQPLETVFKFTNKPEDTSYRKGMSRQRKSKFVFSNTQGTRFDKLAKMCARKLGTNTTMRVFGKLDKQNGLKEYNAMIRVCIENAKKAEDDEDSIEKLHDAYRIFERVKEEGFKIVEETYGQFLTYLIDHHMVEEFFLFCNLIKDENPNSLPRLAYYEMLLWVRVDDEAKIWELCHSFMADDTEDKYSYQENLLLALCESGRKEDFLRLLGTFDIEKVTSIDRMVNIFRSMGKLSLDSSPDHFLLALKRNIEDEKISKLIYEYVISIPNLAVDEILLRFKRLHSKLEVLPTSTEYEKLIKYCCKFFKVHEALDLVEEMLEAGLSLSLDSFHSILAACDQSFEYNLVDRINSLIGRSDVEPTHETSRMMIILFVKMKNYEGAYQIIDDMEKPTVGMYNAILGGYCREKNILSAERVLKQIKAANLKPDATTFSYLISNSDCEKDIEKFCDEMRVSEVQPTMYVSMALINAYAAAGQIEKAKQVLSEEKSVKTLNKLKNVLIAALASHGKLDDALAMYEGIKDSDCPLEPKTIRCLIELLQSHGELSTLLSLLEKLNGSDYWIDSCFRVIWHCVRHENVRSTIDLLKQLRDKFDDSEAATEVFFDEVFCFVAEKEATSMQFGLGLLQAIKEELGLRPSRKSLDFLLHACVTVKDAETSFKIWKEYEAAGLPYNVLSFLCMYRALLASGDRKSAGNILSKMPKDDPQVCTVIRACQDAYLKPEKKQKKALEQTKKLFDILEARIGK